MAKIQKLSPFVADLIAAGEVVERPASVVKELLENSIDAGGTSVTVEIKNGGMSYIRVTDNGCGMSPEDASTAFLRHATSKLRSARDLEAIGTLGFRGEALAAISAVSRVELTTKEPGVGSGVRILNEAGNISEPIPCACPDGTTFIVRDLFFNTPARLKFIKNDRAEGSAVSSSVLKTALSHPEVSVKYIKDGKEEFQTPGDGRTDSCIYSVLGRDFAAGLLPVSYEDDKIKVSGFISSPSSVRGNRTRQFFFVNGRPIKSASLQAALERGYANCLFTGKYPACVLYTDISYGAVDVNVHPTKSEVKFSDESRVFSAVYSAVKSAVDGEQRNTSSADIPISRGTQSVLDAGKNPDIKSGGSGVGFSRVSAGDRSAGFSAEPSFSVGTQYKSFAGRERPTSPLRDYTAAKAPYQTSFELPKTTPVHRPEPAPAQEIFSGTESKDDFTIVGECLETYIIVQKDGRMILIDKHAAHERIIFESLLKNGYESMNQLTIAPIMCDLSREDTAAIMDNQELLNELGFEIDLFGDSAVAVRQLPADIDTGDVRGLLEEICRDLAVGDSGHMQKKREDILHTVACKAAIKAGRRSEPGELYGLVRAVLSDEVRYCPHGRPVSVSFTKGEIDKMFRRT